MSKMIGEPEEETYQCQHCYNYLHLSNISKCPACHFVVCSKCKEKIGKYCNICTKAVRDDLPFVPIVIVKNTKTYDVKEAKKEAEFRTTL